MARQQTHNFAAADKSQSSSGRLPPDLPKSQASGGNPSLRNRQNPASARVFPFLFLTTKPGIRRVFTIYILKVKRRSAPTFFFSCILSFNKFCHLPYSALALWPRQAFAPCRPYSASASQASSSLSLAQPSLSIVNINSPITIPTIVARHIPVSCT